MTAKKRDAALQHETKTLTDDDIVTERKVGRRSFLAKIGATLVGGAVTLLLGRPAYADSSDVDRYTRVVNPDPRPDKDPIRRPSDTKERDQASYADDKDSDVRTMGDPKTQRDQPDSDGSFRDPKDSNVTEQGDSSDKD